MPEFLQPCQPLSQAKAQVGPILYCLERKERQETREQCDLEYWSTKVCVSVDRDTMLYLLIDRDVTRMLGGGREVIISIPRCLTVVGLQCLRTLIVTRCGKIYLRSWLGNCHQRSTQAKSKLACKQQVSKRGVWASCLQAKRTLGETHRIFVITAAFPVFDQSQRPVVML